MTAPTTFEGLKVVVIDDSQDNRELFAVVLRSFGAEVKLAESAAEGLIIQGQFHPDLILCDISMPGEDGYAFLRKLRTLDENAGGKTPVIALIAHTSSDDIRQMLNAGFSSHVGKPSDRTTLARAISKFAKQPIL